MPKLSVIIPSRDEKFLTPTIDDIFRNARGEIEVVAVLDSDKWPLDWKEVTERHGNRLHTIHNGSPRGMRYSINAGVASAYSRGARYVMKTDAHCSFSEGFDEILKADHQSNWVVVPRRGRLDPESWTATETHKPDIDYHYLSFPNDPNDFGGPGLNGKPWNERAIARKDILVDEEMSSQGSCWFMEIDYFNQLELMDESDYGGFWNEFQEIGLKAWLSGGQVIVNKKCKYLHLHKGSKYGRGYKLQESWLKQGAGYTRNWIWNEAWPKQALPFKWLIEHFWPVPSWPNNWEELLYATRKPRAIGVGIDATVGVTDTLHSSDNTGDVDIRVAKVSALKIHSARYGTLGAPVPFHDHSIDVAERVRALVKDGSLDIIVNNSTLTPNQNPFRGKKKVLLLTYSLDESEPVTVERVEKDWLIIGPVKRTSITSDNGVTVEGNLTVEPATENPDFANVYVKRNDWEPIGRFGGLAPMTAAQLNDYLIRKFQISDRRLRGPMPIELRDFHRDDLAQLFAELGFRKGAEIGVAEGKYSEVLLKANPECELLLVDPWHAYSDNPQNKSKEKHEFAYQETRNRMASYPNARLLMNTSMGVVGGIQDNSLDFCYIDGNHLFDYAVMDIIEWSKRVRSGGIVSGDDYYQLDQKRWIGGGVVEAVQAYVNAHRIPIWYIFQGHKSVDFMWVKP